MSNNPPAFPQHPGIQCDGPPSDWHGMTLRDYFAGQALAGLWANSELLKQLPATLRSSKTTNEPDEALANMAYKTADAMLAERSKP